VDAPPAEARPGPAAQPGPEARPGPPFSDLRGRQPVRITAEDGNLVAYGFSDQRVEIPAGSVFIWGPGVGIFALVHGGDARLGNLVSGAVATLALPVLIWRLARRVSRQRRADREELIEGIW